MWSLPLIQVAKFLAMAVEKKEGRVKEAVAAVGQIADK